MSAQIDPVVARMWHDSAPLDVGRLKRFQVGDRLCVGWRSRASAPCTANRRSWSSWWSRSTARTRLMGPRSTTTSHGRRAAWSAGPAWSSRAVWSSWAPWWPRRWARRRRGRGGERRREARVLLVPLDESAQPLEATQRHAEHIRHCHCREVGVGLHPFERTDGVVPPAEADVRRSHIQRSGAGALHRRDPCVDHFSDLVSRWPHCLPLREPLVGVVVGQWEHVIGW